jgi:hypothetical protein
MVQFWASGVTGAIRALIGGCKESSGRRSKRDQFAFIGGMRGMSCPATGWSIRPASA